MESIDGGDFQGAPEPTAEDLRFYEPAELFAEHLADLGLDRYLNVEEVAPVFADLIDRSAWDGTSQPVTAFDLPDESDWAGVHAGSDGTIHLHPRMLRELTLVHKLAHWCLRGRHGHDSRFAVVFARLVEVLYGEEVAGELKALYDDFKIVPAW